MPDHVLRSICESAAATTNHKAPRMPLRDLIGRGADMRSLGENLPTMAADKTKVAYDINIAYQKPEEAAVRNAAYPDYLPAWPAEKFPPLAPFEFNDPALRVSDTTLPNLLGGSATGSSGAGKLSDIQPGLGTIVSNVQLSDLSQEGKDELAWLISHRKVVVFPDQDLIDAGFEAQETFMKHFGKLNYQPVSGTVAGHPAFHVIHRDGNKDELAAFFAQKSSSCLWHQDVSFERQPPGYVMLGLLEGPSVGGDSVFAAADTAYKRLSQPMQQFLDRVKAVHSSEKMISKTLAMGGLVRKDPVRSVHPLVRVHPVTGKKSLFLNREFVVGLAGFKETESDMLLSFLMNHLITGHDFQARVKWLPRTIVMFDNRSTIHTASVDYIGDDGHAKPRHIFRLAAMAESPIPVHESNDSISNGNDYHHVENGLSSAVASG